MKRNCLSGFGECLLLWILPIILGEFIFQKIYLEPFRIIDLQILSIPIYNISLSFFLKFIVFELSILDITINLFITRKYYGFPYPEIFCPFFAIITIFDIVFVLGNFLYAVFYIPGLYQIIKLVKELDLYDFRSIDYDAFFPAIPIIVIFIVATIYYKFIRKSKKEFDAEDIQEIEEIYWLRDLVVPGETGYHNNQRFLYRCEGVFVCYIMIYRFVVLMNIRLSYFEIIGILLGLLTLFLVFEHNRYEKHLKEDLHYLYEKLAGQLYFQDGMHWKDLVNFQILELQRLKKIEEQYKNTRIRNIRWLELYEHMVVNDAKSIHDAIENWEDGIYSIEKAMEEIKPRISSIGKISTDCVPILPNSRKFNPKELDLIAYFQAKIPLTEGKFLNEEAIESYSGFADTSDLSSIIQIVKEYLSLVSDDPFVCIPQIDNAGWLNIIFVSSNLTPIKLCNVRRDIKRIGELWEESETIDYYNFPIELAVARSYMKDIDGDMSMILEDNCLKFILNFPATSVSKDRSDDGRRNDVIDINKFLEKYTLHKENYVPFHNSKKMYILADSNLLTEIMDHFAQYAWNRIEDNYSILVSTEKMDDTIYISLSFLCSYHFYPIKNEIQETLQYWRTRKELVPEHSSLSLLMLKNKMDQLSGSVDLSLEEDYFHCRLMFSSYELN